MAMTAKDIEGLILKNLPGAKVAISDLAGDGEHYAARVVFAGFKGLPKVKQHQIVYKALEGRMGGALHALALTTCESE